MALGFDDMRCESVQLMLKFFCIKEFKGIQNLNNYKFLKLYDYVTIRSPHTVGQL